MRIGDLPRTRKPARPFSRPVVGALFVLLAVGSAVAGWQALPSAEVRNAPQASAPAKQDQARAPQASPAPSQKSPVQVADANAGISYGSSLNSRAEIPAVAEPAPRVRASTKSHAAAAEIPLATPESRLDTAPVAPPAVSPEPAPAPSAAPAEITGTGSTQAALAPEPEEQPSGLVDLNTGSFEDLNTLENGGPIGRAIIKGRPYASAEELVTKKVLRRSVYEQIKDQVTVR